MLSFGNRPNIQFLARRLFTAGREVALGNVLIKLCSVFHDHKKSKMNNTVSLT